MNEKEKRENEFIEIDLGRIFKAILNRSWMVAAVSVVAAVMAFAYTFFFVTPMYKSAAMFYVNNSSFSVGDASLSLTTGDISASRNLVKSYIVILNTRSTLNDVIDYAGVNRSYSQVKSMIAAASVDETEIFQVVVTSPDPYEAERIANAITYILPKRIANIIDGTSAKVVDTAVVPSGPSSPSYTSNVIIGFLLGLALSVGVVVIKEIFDITIRSEEDVARSCSYPILTAVPDMTEHSKGSYYYYGYGRRRRSYYYANSAKKKAAYHASAYHAAAAYQASAEAQKAEEKESAKKSKAKALAKKAYNTDKTGNEPVLIGEGISFAATEAYKLLRAKIQFSFADNSKCRVLGLSSALSGEGKSLTSVNLAYTLSQLDKKVILIDGDMRRPTLAEKLGIQKKPGLSSFLTNQSPLEELVQQYTSGSTTFDVIAAGQNPPNPVELLSSERMTLMLEMLRSTYDYVILDLPPVGEVSDAMAVADRIDGLLIVVRQNYCDRTALSNAVRLFSFINLKVLGVVFNCTSEHSGKYGYSKNYYRRYYRGYYRRYYRSSYENHQRSVMGKEEAQK